MVMSMNSRMDKYNYDKKPTSRTDRNKDLYNEINKTELTKYDSFSNAKVIDESAKEIDLDKIKKYVEKINSGDITERKSLLDATENISERKIREEEEKDYDLISVLEKAREKREVDYQKERYKKLRDTQYDILSNLRIPDKKEINDEEKYNTQEKTLIDLINTVALNKNKNDLLSELSEGNETIVGSIAEEGSNNDLKALINEEIQKSKSEELKKVEPENTKKITKEIEPIKNIDNSFYTNSLNFSKEDFEGFDDINEKSHVLAKIGIIFLILCILGVLFFIANYVFDLNLF